MGNTNSATTKTVAVETKKAPCEKKIEGKPNVDAVTKLPILKYDINYFLPSAARVKTPKRIKKTKPLTESAKAKRRAKLIKQREDRQERSNYEGIMRKLFTQIKDPEQNEKLKLARDVKKQQKRETKKQKKKKKKENQRLDNIMAQNDDYLFKETIKF